MGYDVWLSDDRDLPISSILLGLVTATKNDDDITYQKCLRRVLTCTNEWVFDKSVGMPYTTWARRKVDVNAYKLLIKADLKEVTGVNRVEVDARFDEDSRQVFVTISIVLNNGATGFLNVQPMTVLFQKAS